MVLCCVIIVDLRQEVNICFLFHIRTSSYIPGCQKRNVTQNLSVFTCAHYKNAVSFFELQGIMLYALGV